MGIFETTMRYVMSLEDNYDDDDYQKPMPELFSEVEKIKEMVGGDPRVGCCRDGSLDLNWAEQDEDYVMRLLVNVSEEGLCFYGYIDYKNPKIAAPKFKPMYDSKGNSAQKIIDFYNDWLYVKSQN